MTAPEPPAGPHEGRARAPTLDDLFRHGVNRRPGEVALADPPDRESFTDGAPRRLTYAQADRVIDALAARLRLLSPRPGTAVGIQLPNTVEAVLTILAVLRAGMVAAPLPLLWRAADCAAALDQLGARILITATRCHDFDPCAVAMQVAAEVFAIRHVCAFGAGVPDGVIGLDEALVPAPTASPFEAWHDDGAAAAAFVSWQVGPDGTIAVRRDHGQLIASGLAVLREARLAPDSRLLACCAPTSFGGFALSVMPWLLTGGTLHLHHGFDAEAFAAQCRDERCDAVVVPGPVLNPLRDADVLSHPELRNVLAYWRAPERLATAPAWRHPAATLTDLLVFGETAVLGTRRDDHGRPMALPAGPGVMRTAAGTLAVRDPMVPTVDADAAGFVDTGYPCRDDPIAHTLTVTGPPPGIVSVGGYRFAMEQVTGLVRRADTTAAVAALPDALTGQRLAGIPGRSGKTRAALRELGANLLLTGAFPQR